MKVCLDNRTFLEDKCTNRSLSGTICDQRSKRLLGRQPAPAGVVHTAPKTIRVRRDAQSSKKKTTRRRYFSNPSHFSPRRHRPTENQDHSIRRRGGPFARRASVRAVVDVLPTGTRRRCRRYYRSTARLPPLQAVHSVLQMGASNGYFEDQ